MTLNAANISFRYSPDSREILRNFSLSIESGERVGLIAPSGVGKTTFCKILAGYEKPEQGTVLLDNRPLHTYRGYSPVQMIWQHPEQVLNPRLRMKDSISEAGTLEPHIIKELGIQQDWLNRYPTELSGGELQRFCIARALGKDTKFILADEITTMLDLVTQSLIWTFLHKETERRNIGLLIVSHSKPLLDNICTRQLIY